MSEGRPSGNDAAAATTGGAGIDLAVTLERYAWDVVPPVLLALVMLEFDRPRTSEVAFATVLIVILPLLLRRLWPVPVLVVVAAGVLLTAPRGGSIVGDIGAIVLAAFEVGLRASNRMASVAFVLGLAAALAAVLLLQQADPVQSVVLPFVILVPAWLVGDLIRARNLERAARVEAIERQERDRIVQIEATAARQRQEIARELHDVLAHSVSVMVVQAGAARQVVRSSPEEADKALLAVEETGRQAMAELRGMLGVLAPDDEGGGVTPQPGVNDIGRLVARIRDAGLPAELQVDGQVRELPRGTDVTAYRIVQEGLTNALRYSNRAKTLVHVAYEPDRLRVEVLDDGPTATGAGAAPGQGAGRGLQGLHARAASVGGRLEAGPRLGGGFAVRAWLPLTDATQTAAR